MTLDLTINFYNIIYRIYWVMYIFPRTFVLKWYMFNLQDCICFCFRLKILLFIVCASDKNVRVTFAVHWRQKSIRYNIIVQYKYGLVIFKRNSNRRNHTIFQNESKRYRFKYYSQGGAEDPERLCKRMVQCVRYDRRKMLEKPSVPQNQWDRRLNQTLQFAGVHYILAWVYVSYSILWKLYISSVYLLKELI